MATADSVLQVIARALFDPNPTTDETSERYLATALGYPSSWHVVRRMEDETTTTTTIILDKNGEEEEEQEEGGGGYSSSTNNRHNHHNNNDNKKERRRMIVDRIYAGNPREGHVDMWFNHPAAQAAAEEWVEGESGPYDKKGGQMLPRKPKFQKGDQVKVLFEGDWCSATVQKRTEKKDGFRYNVHYLEDNSTQKMVREEDIELMDDPYDVAEGMGLPGWQAKLQGKKWKFISPDGKNFTSKTAAMKHKKKLDKTGSNKRPPAPAEAKEEPEETKLSEGDPPWRTTGHEYLGRRVRTMFEHKKSATRTVTVEQVGTVKGWISETDVDKNGGPGYISERTSKPANLFEVVFDGEPSHPYYSLLLERQDMEQWEIEAALVPLDEEGPPNKKQKA